MLSCRDSAVLDAIFTCRGEYSGISFKEKDLQEIQLEEKEIEGVQLAEKGNLGEAIDFFSKLIDNNPSYASAYNNRAQVYRMSGENLLALNDLEICISLEPSAFVLRKAYSQRAAIYKSIGDTQKSEESLIKAAQNGSLEAKLIVKEKNPFAKICNQVLSEIQTHLKYPAQ
jgi:tetratricopeptide (TPR) repeat protein